MYLFDTNILSEVIKRKPNKVLMKRLKETPGNAQFTSCICVMEMRYGSRRKDNYKNFWVKIEERILSKVNILEFGYRESIFAGDIRAALASIGRSISLADLMIASTAVAHDLILVTGNIRHFEGVPRIRLENWLG